MPWEKGSKESYQKDREIPGSDLHLSLMTSEDVTLATVLNDIWGNDKVIPPFDKSSLVGSPPEDS